MNIEISVKKILMIIGVLVVCSIAGTLKDSRDGKTYKTVEIGDQVWMAENLNYKTSESFCYDNEGSNCKKYGRLYTWEAAMKACPAGWHLPKENEFETLLKKVGPSKEKRSANLRASSWENGQDKFGFSALPAGYYYSSSEEFYDLGGIAYFWSSTEYDEGNAYGLGIGDGGADVGYDYKSSGFSVRCLKDSNEEREASLARPSGAGAATAQNLGTMKDSRDGQTYRTVKIGDQTWMAENLNYKVNDGKQSWCYDNDPANCKKYGRLYTWDAAKMVCPSGWHLPSKEEFEILLAKVGPSKEKRSTNLRASSWEGGQDKFGFSALPAGDYYSDGKEFYDLGGYAYFWSSTEDTEGYAYSLGISGSSAGVGNDAKYYGFSVRCLKDTNEEREASLARPSGAGAATAQKLGTMKDSRDGQTYRTVKIGDQTWMAENLNYKVNDGEQSWCYDNKVSNCKIYGRLYTWAAAVGMSESKCGKGKECNLCGQVQGVCPAGWHLPSEEEWGTLLTKVGGVEFACAGEGEGCYSFFDGADLYKFGFTMLGAGYRQPDGDFYQMRGEVHSDNFWSSTEGFNNGDDAIYFYDGNNVYDEHKNVAFSVRCLKDSNEGVGSDVIGDGLAGLLGSGGGGIATKAKGSIKIPSERDIDMGAGGGSRSAADIMKVVRQRTPGLRHIYNKHLKEKPGFQGKVTLRFTIAPDGEVISISIASSTTGNGEFDGEIKKAVGRWKFSKVKFGNTTVTIPFTFSE